MLDDIFSTQDVDLERLKRIAGIDEEINKFIDKYKDISVALKKSIFPKHDETKAEKARFLAEYELRIKQGDKETKEIIKEFDHEKKHLFR
jgi:transcription elongation factor